MENNPTAQNTPLSEEELEAIAGGAMRDRPKATREEQNQMMLDALLKKGVNINMEQVKDSRTLHEITFSPFNK
jgi:hypothetical protein